ncbi:MAG: Hsp20 family protein [Candidatus Paceibacterota bacterium]
MSNNRRPFTIADLLNNMESWSIGLDRQFQSLQNLATNNRNFPPYNIKAESNEVYKLELAVAGFSKEEILITLDDKTLKIDGAKKENEDEPYIYKGIASRNFSLSYALADHVEVKDATLSDGVLVITLSRIVPEEKQPKLIKIS